MAVILFATGTLRLNVATDDEKKKPRAERSPSLEDLGYIANPVKAGDENKRGVTKRTDKVEDGLVLYHSIGWHSGVKEAPATLPWNEIRLIDLDGKVVHKWSPKLFDTKKPVHGSAVIRPNGNLLLQVGHGGKLAELDWDGKVAWTLPGGFHHDMTLGPDGTLYALAGHWTPREVQVEGVGERKIMDESIMIVSPEGEKLEELWLADVLADEPHYQATLKTPTGIEKRKGGLDIFHMNSIEPLPAHPEGLWQQGDLLLSSRSLNLVFVMSRDGSKILWRFGPEELDRQHSATPLSPERFLVFDNGTDTRHYSRVLEIDVASKTIAWKYQADPPEEFYSATRGMSQGLAGGNVFVVSSNRGCLFEVTREGEVVWEFFSAERFKNKQSAIRAYKIQGETLANIRERLASG